MEKLDQILQRLDGIDRSVQDTGRKVDAFDTRLGQVEENVRWLRGQNFVTQGDLERQLARIDPTYRKQHWALKAGKEVLRGGVIIGVGALVRWIFSPSKKAQQLAPTQQVEVGMSGPGRTTVRELRPN